MKKFIVAFVVLVSALSVQADADLTFKMSVQQALDSNPTLPYLAQVVDLNPDNVSVGLLGVGSTTEDTPRNALKSLSQMFLFSIGQRSDNPAPETYKSEGHSVVCEPTLFDSDKVQCILTLIDINDTRAEFSVVSEVDSEGKFKNLTGTLTLTLYGNSSESEE